MKRRRPLCSDTFTGSRNCTKAPHSKDEAHSDGKRFWWSGEPVAAWRRWTLEHLNAKDMTR